MEDPMQTGQLLPAKKFTGVFLWKKQPADEILGFYVKLVTAQITGHAAPPTCLNLFS